jgi:class 3 adenylate cyclase
VRKNTRGVYLALYCRTRRLVRQDEMPRLHDHIRMDFSVEILETNEATREIRFALRPDPRRYEWVEQGGERMLLDRLDDQFIPERVLKQMAENVAGIPMFFAPPKLDDALAYVDARRSTIADQLSGMTAPPAINDPSGDLLRELAGYKLNFAVISVDLVGSTNLATTLPTDQYASLIQTLLGELAAITPLFRGHVLKYTGDGLIAFIPGPSPNSQNDLAIDCALTMRALVYEALNPELVSAGLPAVDVRIGIDAGEAAVLVLGSPTTKAHADLIGDVVSLACKVEAAGTGGSIHIGGIAARSMHVQWRELFESVPVPPGWSYTDEDGKPYAIYRVKDGKPRSTQEPTGGPEASRSTITGVNIEYQGFVTHRSGRKRSE